MTQQNNIFQEIDEDLERQKLEAFWEKYGNLVIASAIALVLGTAAFTGWDSWRNNRYEAATQGLVTLDVQKGVDPAKKIEALQAFADKNNYATQATFARLQAGDIAAKKGDKDKAVQIYDTVANDASADSAFRQLATLLSVQTQMDNGDPVALQKKLQPLLAVNAPWRYTAMEYDAFLALKAGDKAKAKEIFTELSQDASVPQSLGQLASDMLRYVSE